MSTQPQRQAERVQVERTRWRVSTRVAFRFCFAYLTVFCLTTQVLPGLFPIPKIDIPDLGSIPPVRPIVQWTAAHVFAVSKPLVYQGSGSGDKTFDWVLSFCALAAAAVVTAVWSIVHRKRENYVALHKWFHTILRFAVGSELLLYGMVKFVPLQMPFPFLTRLLEPFGNFSPMGVLWSSIGASPGYEMFTGSAEMLGGILLFIPRTAVFGALVCLADTTEVFMLNMTYDVPVKLFSFHLMVMSLILLAPELGRITRFFFSDAAVGPPRQAALFGSARANRVAFAVQVAFGLLLIAGNAYDAWTGWNRYGGGAPKSPLYGIWNVDQFSIDGELRPPLLTDKQRWRRVIFDRPAFATLQRMDESFVGYGAAIELKDSSISLTSSADKNSKAALKFQRIARERLTLDGHIDSHHVRVELTLFDRNALLLVSRGFHWIQEYPFNR